VKLLSFVERLSSQPKHVSHLTFFNFGGWPYVFVARRTLHFSIESGKWVAKQREQMKLLKQEKHSFLTPYRLEKLNQIGFVWQVRTALDSEDGDDMADAEPSSVDPAAVASAAGATSLEEPTSVAAPEGIARAAPTDAATATVDAAASLEAVTAPATEPTPTPLVAKTETMAEVEQPAPAVVTLPNADETAYV
jgi:hypothetical protein